MNSASKKAILVVSFGTSYENTRKVTIDAIPGLSNLPCMDKQDDHFQA